MKRTVLALVFCGAAFLAVPSRAITFGPFGPHGEGGSKNGQSFTIGPGGSVYELDAFVSVEGFDLNGPVQPGTSAQLSQYSLPAGMVYSFTNALSADQTAVVLTYAFSNTTSTVFTNVRFFVLLDAEIDQSINTFFNEYGTVKGVAGHGAVDGSPDEWQIDEPGFTTGTLYRNLFLGALDNSNSIPQSAPNDVALALGFTIGDIAPGGAPALQVMISENGNSLGSLALVQHDSDPNSKTFITLSGGIAPALSGGVFVDANANGVMDAGEGLPNVTLLLSGNGGAVVTNAVTDANGRYGFNVAPGTYSLALNTTALPAGLVLAPVVNGATSDPMPVTLLGGVAQTVNWGYDLRSAAAIQGQVSVVGTNGAFQAALANLTVILMSTNGAFLAQITTDTNGLYNFGNAVTPNPAPGTYWVELLTTNLPAGLTPQAVPNGPTNNPSVVVLPPSQTATNNFAFVRPLSSGRAQFYFTSWTNNWVTGSLLGTLRIANTNLAGTAPEPFQLGLLVSANFYWATNELRARGIPFAVTPDLPNIDLTALVHGLNGGSLNPGDSVVVTNIPVFSRARVTPADIHSNTNFVWVPTNSPSGAR